MDQFILFISQMKFIFWNVKSESYFYQTGHEFAFWAILNRISSHIFIFKIVTFYNPPYLLKIN